MKKVIAKREAVDMPQLLLSEPPQKKKKTKWKKMAREGETVVTSGSHPTEKRHIDDRLMKRGARRDQGSITNNQKRKWWALLTSPAKNLEDLKLELPLAWEPMCSESSS